MSSSSGKGSMSASAISSSERGSGRCTMCKGTGVNHRLMDKPPCSSCNGTGNCPYCFGSGLVGGNKCNGCYSGG